nr:APC membrane recruitment protein like [Ipomoea batatas]
MVSLATHFTSFVFLLPLGIRRLLCSSSLYLKNPALFRSRIWYFSDPKWKNIDFYALLIVLPLASFSLVFLFSAFSVHPTYGFSLLNQSLVIFLFWVLMILIIAKESFDLCSIPEGFLFIFAGIAFYIEFLMNGKGIVGLGGDLYGVLGMLALICAACCMFLAIRPTAFLGEFLLSSVLVLKGTWVLQVGLSLFTDTIGFNGCEKITEDVVKGNADVKCPLEEDRLRGLALMNLLFVGHVILVMILSFLFFGVANWNRNLRSGETNGPLLAEIRPEGVPMHQLSEFEIE